MTRLTVGCALIAALLLISAAPSAARKPSEQGSYRVTNLPSLDGSSSVGYSINNRSWVAGRSNLPGNQVRHATLWRGGSLLDLGTLGSPERNSAVLWPVKNVRGIITGVSQTDEPDPLGEAWSCAAFFPAATATGYRCVGFKWQDGVMTELPTLGGTHGFATGANNRGQVVGISGVCDQALGRFSAIHAVLWERGRPIDIGDLGGVAWNTPMAINRHGDIVGFANSSAADGGDFNPRAFVRTHHGRVRSLGTLHDDATSQALSINARREIVGTSCDADGNCRAFLSRNGVLIDLNTLIDGAYRGRLTAANDIDDRGRITGQAVDEITGQFVAYEARPRR